MGDFVIAVREVADTDWRVDRQMNCGWMDRWVGVVDFGPAPRALSTTLLQTLQFWPLFI